jgi:hypothetical protein
MCLPVPSCTLEALLGHVTVTPLNSMQNPELAGIFEISRLNLSSYSWEWMQGSCSCPSSQSQGGAGRTVEKLRNTAGPPGTRSRPVLPCRGHSCLRGCVAMRAALRAADTTLITSLGSQLGESPGIFPSRERNSDLLSLGQWLPA